MGRSSQLVFPYQKTFAAVLENRALRAGVFWQRIPRGWQNRRLCFEAALFIRWSWRGHGTDPRENRRFGKAARMDSAKESRVRRVCADGGRAKVKSRNPNDVTVAGRKSTSDASKQSGSYEPGQNDGRRFQ